jgi:hypothetical protein
MLKWYYENEKVYASGGGMMTKNLSTISPIISNNSFPRIF